MPTLDFKGKQFVYSHHLSVPFRELRIAPDKSLPAPGKTPSLDDNLIIHGDNLEALKALLPTHAGKVDCIFIDPPYNTGNEGWSYNDNVRSPLMQEWLKKSANPVDKEDLERHDKWLCMMWPRLMLLKELLSEKGCIWITLDDNEAHRFKVLMDEIFGEDNFVTSIAWQKMYTVKNSAKYFSEMHDHVFVYAKDINLWERKLLSDEGKEENYSNPDNDPRGPWTTNAIQARNFYSQGSYEIIAPSGRVHTPPKGTFWRISQENFNALNSDKRIWWGKGGDSIPRIKKLLSESKDGVVPSTLWSYKEAGSNATAKDQLRSIFSDSDSDLFMTPKPDILIQRILQISSNKDSIILDSFAGSGTTAHAVLKMNNIDGGCRRFILIECEDYAETLTAERVRRVIKGYKFKGTIKTELYSEKLSWNSFEKKHQLITDKIHEITEKNLPKYNVITKEIKDGVIQVVGENTVEESAAGVPGSFTYCILGEAIQIESLLTGHDMPSFESLARYVFYTATGLSLHTIAKASVDGFIGETDLFRVHLFYQPDQNWLRSNEAALNSDKVTSIVNSNSTKKRTIVFAVAKFMSQKELTAARIEFCQLPYAIHRIMGA